MKHPRKANRRKRGRPFWNFKLRELWVGDRLVIKFGQPARTQEPILQAFQEEGWPEAIFDPLPPDPDGKVDSKDRLHAAIGNLNRHQKIIQFFGVGTGESIGWKLR